MPPWPEDDDEADELDAPPLPLELVDDVVVELDVTLVDDDVPELDAACELERVLDVVVVSPPLPPVPAKPDPFAHDAATTTTSEAPKRKPYLMKHHPEPWALDRFDRAYKPRSKGQRSATSFVNTIRRRPGPA